VANVTVETMQDVNSTLRSRIAALKWHHSIDLGGGIVTPGGKSLAICNDEASRIFDRIDLVCKSVLDVGAWNGVFSFDAKRRGAARVLATDSYCWSHPQIRGRETFDIARAALGLDVEAREIDVAELTPDTVGDFDIVLFLGVFYHRYDAIEALAKVARLAKHLLIVETHLDLRDIDRPAMVFYPGRELANDPTNWWGPNEHCVHELLLGYGFKEIEMTAHPAGHNRAIFHAWRSTEARLKPLAEEFQLRPLAEAIWLDRKRKHPVLARIDAARGLFDRIFSRNRHRL
jgi:tRNA (mo5U34)-methyltransferase